MRLRVPIICLFILAVASVWSGTALAKNSPATNAKPPVKRYQGWDNQRVYWHNTAPFQIQVGLTMFYRVYERWPKSWKEVVQSGIWQTPLVGFDNRTLDPDDKQLTQFGDTIYNSEVLPPTVEYISMPDGQKSVVKMSPPETYRQAFARIDKLYKSNRKDALSPNLGDRNLMTQYAILGATMRMLACFYSIHGDYPKTFKEYLDSGLGPIDSHSINPVTAKPFRGKGEAGDILYGYAPKTQLPNGEQGTAFKLWHFLRSGKRPRINFSY